MKLEAFDAVLFDPKAATGAVNFPATQVRSTATGSGEQALAYTPRGGEHDQENAGRDASYEQVVGRHLRHDGIQNQRHRRGEEQSERPRRRQQPEREAVSISVLQKRRKQQAAQRQNRHPRTACKYRKKGTLNHLKYFLK